MSTVVPQFSNPQFGKPQHGNPSHGNASTTPHRRTACGDTGWNTAVRTTGHEG